jgi:hypothetical protein
MTSQIGVVTLHIRHPELLILRYSLRVSKGIRECPSGSLSNFLSNKHRTAFFFAPLGHGLFRCNLSGHNPKQVRESGYSSLLAHLAGQHEGFETLYASSARNSSRSRVGFIPEEVSHLFQWIQWIIMRNMPIHEVKDELTRAMSKLQPVKVKAVKKYMEWIAIKIGNNLEVELGELFGLMFDGLSHAGVHYVALFAVYEADGELRVSLTGLSPLVDGTQTEDAHVQLFESVLDV